MTLKKKIPRETRRFRLAAHNTSGFRGSRLGRCSSFHRDFPPQLFHPSLSPPHPPPTFFQQRALKFLSRRGMTYGMAKSLFSPLSRTFCLLQLPSTLHLLPPISPPAPIRPVGFAFRGYEGVKKKEIENMYTCREIKVYYWSLVDTAIGQCVLYA